MQCHIGIVRYSQINVVMKRICFLFKLEISAFTFVVVVRRSEVLPDSVVRVGYNTFLIPDLQDTI